MHCAASPIGSCLLQGARRPPFNLTCQGPNVSFNFRSDNEAPAAPAILEALVEANAGSVSSYGDDPFTARLEKAFERVFETSVQVWPLATGTAANALAIAQLCPPYGAVYCHGNAHLHTDECGAPEFFSGGAKLLPLPGEHAKIDAAELRRVLASAGVLGDHECLPAALSLSQATEFGAAYSAGEVQALSGIAHEHGLRVHMDGARFANAIVALNCSPADITWRAGVDMLSFGATKNGALMAEALLIFDRELADQLGRRRKRAGHLLSKMRFVSAQLNAYLEDDLWLKLAATANTAATRLAAGLGQIDGVQILHPVQANEVFAKLPKPLVRGLREAGFAFHDWPGRPGVYRLVAPWCIESGDVDRFLAAAKRLAA